MSARDSISGFFHAIHPVWGDVSIKAPRTRFIGNDNDDHIDARSLLRQEATFNGFFADHGIPAPRAFDLQVDGAATDDLIGAHVRHDQSTPSPRECGALLARMHAIAPPANLKCVADDDFGAGYGPDRLLQRRHP